MSQNKLNLNRIPYPVWFFLILLNFILILVVITPILNKQTSNSENNVTLTTAEPSIQLPSSTSKETSAAVTTPNSPILSDQFNQDLFLLISFYKDQQNHIYTYRPGENHFFRLFDSPYEEIDPALNTDKTKLAYSAKKNGYWDIYVYNFTTGEEIRITDTAAYDGKPTWSPDGEFLAYTSYLNGNLDIFIQSIDDLDSTPIQLTEDPSADFDPVWSPSGREIAFVSARSGDLEIWIALLNTVTDRFTNISNRSDFQDSNPAWIPDSEEVMWRGEKDNNQKILRTDITQLPLESFGMAYANFAEIFSDYFVTIQENANQTFLSIQEIKTKQAISFPVEIPGSVNGLQAAASTQFPEEFLEELKNHPHIQAFNPADETQEIRTQNNLNRENINLLMNVEAPYPYLNEAAISAFDLLRIDTADLIGWDFLSNLEEAYLPITNPAAPDLQENWLYTGRAFKFNPLTLYADLAVAVKEDQNGLTFWRIYLKARYQDGSQGKPLMQTPWKLDARYLNDPQAYESGGYYDQIPDGYWVDFTQIAKDHRWYRQPSLPTWRQYFNGALFNLFVYKDGLDWYQAMQQIYPIESIKSPTPIPSLTSTPTFTPTVRFFRSPTATLTPTSTPIPTRRPTWTPVP